MKISLEHIIIHNLKNVNVHFYLNEIVVFTGISGSGKSSLVLDAIFSESFIRYSHNLPPYLRKKIILPYKPYIKQCSNLTPCLLITNNISKPNVETIGSITKIHENLISLFTVLGEFFCPITNSPIYLTSEEKILDFIYNNFSKNQKLYILSPISNRTDQIKLLKEKNYGSIRLNNKIIKLPLDLNCLTENINSLELVVDRLSLNDENSLRLKQSLFQALKEKHRVIIHDPNISKDYHFFSRIEVNIGAQKINISSLSSNDFYDNESEEKLFYLNNFIKIKDKSLYDLCNSSFHTISSFLSSLKVSKKNTSVFSIISNTLERLNTLDLLNLSYLSTNQLFSTLSGGEKQRVLLARQINFSFSGITYILDEPSQGTHPLERKALISACKKLQSQGNTILIIEHDEQFILSSDRMIDLGPSSGKGGGKVLFNDTIQNIDSYKDSVTAGYLLNPTLFPINKYPRKGNGQFLILSNANYNNLKNITVTFPLGTITAVVGVSGSGKSSLVKGELLSLLLKKSPKSNTSTLKGLEQIDKVILIDSTPIGKHSRSFIASYIDIFDKIREEFASLEKSKILELSPSHFSFNFIESRCPECSGKGTCSFQLNYSDSVTCPLCSGTGFKEKILSVKYLNKTIDDILSLTVKEASLFFSIFPSIEKKLKTLCYLGLGHLLLKQRCDSLSLGEAKRLKLSKSLIKAPKKHTLYILDEPTIGLHPQDVRSLLEFLNKFLDLGHSVIFIEHNIHIIKSADFIIELGPTGGSEGGYLLTTGTPESLALGDTPTGLYLKKEFFPENKNIPSKKPSFITKNEHDLIIFEAQEGSLNNLSISLPKNFIIFFLSNVNQKTEDLVFKIIFQEGQIAYLNSLSSSVQNLLPKIAVPKVKDIKNISPSIALKHDFLSFRFLETLGTITELYKHIAFIFSQLGQPFCPLTGEKVCLINENFILSFLLKHHKNSFVTILIPLETDNIDQRLSILQQSGFVRLLINSNLYDIDDCLPKNVTELFLIIDRIKVCETETKRLLQSLKKAKDLSKSSVVIDLGSEKKYFYFGFASEYSLIPYPKLEPDFFSFSNSKGMCLKCQGVGCEFHPKLNLLFTIFLKDSLKEIFFFFIKSQELFEEFLFFCSEVNLNPLSLLDELSQEDRNLFLFGSPKTLSNHFIPNGLLSFIQKSFDLSLDSLKTLYPFFLELTPCSQCLGSRLNNFSSHVKITDKNILDICKMPIENLMSFLSSFDVSYDAIENSIRNIKNKILTLQSLNLGHLNLHTSSLELSETQLYFLKIADQLDNQLSGLTYTCEDPLTSLHPRDKIIVLESLKKLKNYNNTILATCSNLDPLILDDNFLKIELSTNEKGSDQSNIISNAKTNLKDSYKSYKANHSASDKLNYNYNDHNIDFPLNTLSCICGTSGSGKTSLLSSLFSLEKRNKQFSAIWHKNYPSLTTKSLGEFLGIEKILREFFSSLPIAKMENLSPNDFQKFSSGACPECLGEGVKKIPVSHLTYKEISCSRCFKSGLHPRILNVTYQEKHFGKILDMPLENILELFSFLSLLKVSNLELSLFPKNIPLNTKMQDLSLEDKNKIFLFLSLTKEALSPPIFFIDQPSFGLSKNSLDIFLDIVRNKIEQGATFIVADSNFDLITNSAFIVELASAPSRKVLFQGSIQKLLKSTFSEIKSYF